MNAPLAYFLTWTCYGTWLHGDPRGSVDDTHNIYSTPYLPESSSRHTTATNRLRDPPFSLREPARAVVRAAIESHCTHRNWPLHALNVRSNHVHCVLSAPAYAPEVAMGQLKTWSSRRLRDAGLAPPKRSPLDPRGQHPPPFRRVRPPRRHPLHPPRPRPGHLSRSRQRSAPLLEPIAQAIDFLPPTSRAIEPLRPLLDRSRDRLYTGRRQQLGRADDHEQVQFEARVRPTFVPVRVTVGAAGR